MRKRKLVKKDLNLVVISNNLSEKLNRTDKVINNYYNGKYYFY